MSRRPAVCSTYYESRICLPCGHQGTCSSSSPLTRRLSPTLPPPHSLFLSFTLVLTQSLFLSHSFYLSLSLSHCLVDVCPTRCLSHSHSRSHSVSLCRARSLSHTHTRCLSHSLSLSLVVYLLLAVSLISSHDASYSLSLSLTVSLTHCLSHPHSSLSLTLRLSLSPARAVSCTLVDSLSPSTLPLSLSYEKGMLYERCCGGGASYPGMGGGKVSGGGGCGAQATRTQMGPRVVRLGPPTRRLCAQSCERYRSIRLPRRATPCLGSSSSTTGGPQPRPDPPPTAGGSRRASPTLCDCRSRRWEHGCVLQCVPHASGRISCYQKHTVRKADGLWALFGCVWGLPFCQILVDCSDGGGVYSQAGG